MKTREKWLTNTYFIQWRYKRIVSNTVKSLSEISVELLHKESSNTIGTMCPWTQDTQKKWSCCACTKWSLKFKKKMVSHKNSWSNDLTSSVTNRIQKYVQGAEWYKLRSYHIIERRGFFFRIYGIKFQIKVTIILPVQKLRF